jgi:NADH-quinone oxidoreductase subunit G
MLESALKGYVLLGGIDPSLDFGVAPRGLGSSQWVVAVTTHLPESLRAAVHVVLPIGTFAETSGTFVNAEGCWQSWTGAAKLPGESRPGWKVLRVLANALNLPGMNYDSSEEIREALRSASAGRLQASAGPAPAWPQGAASPADWVEVPPYQTDALVRGSEALSKTKDGRVLRTVI